MNTSLANQFSQSGAALIIGMVMMLLLTIIGLSAMQGTVMQEQMAGNLRDKELAFQAAEETLRHVESWLAKQDKRPETNSFPCANQNGCVVYKADSGNKGPVACLLNREFLNNKHKDCKGWLNNSLQVADLGGGYTSISGLAAEPRFVIEYLGVNEETVVVGKLDSESGQLLLDEYQITVRSVGGSNQSEVILQSVFAKRY